VPPRDWNFRVQDILRAARKIVEHTRGVSFEHFSTEEWLLDAILRNLTVIGEAAAHVPDEVCGRYPEIPWQDYATCEI
jgi:uncharacterized protein with HEPN domain